ncbi:hypothetical protein MYX75_01320 [Acidobacteria bacterium AH-259-A15]|nr:hypothetical protein [Acidobacteria bacterium AH-259-A15]
MSRTELVFLAIFLVSPFACSRGVQEEEASEQVSTPKNSAVEEAGSSQVEEPHPAQTERKAALETRQKREQPAQHPEGSATRESPGASLPATPAPEPQTEATDTTIVATPPRAEAKEETTRGLVIIEPPPPPRPITAVVSEGTVLEVRLAEVVSTKTNKSGDQFEALLDKDLIGDGKIVVPQGSKVIGEVLDLQESGKVKGRAGMTLILTEIHVGGRKYPIETNEIEVRAEGTKGRDAKVIGGATGVGALIGGILGGKKGAAIGAAVGGGAGTAKVLTTKGKEVEFQAEQLFSFRLEKDIQVKLR